MDREFRIKNKKQFDIKKKNSFFSIVYEYKKSLLPSSKIQKNISQHSSSTMNHFCLKFKANYFLYAINYLKLYAYLWVFFLFFNINFKPRCKCVLPLVVLEYSAIFYNFFLFLNKEPYWEESSMCDFVKKFMYKILGSRIKLCLRSQSSRKIH